MADIRTGPGRTFAASPFSASGPFSVSSVGRGCWDLTRSHGGRSPPSRAPAPASARRGNTGNAGRGECGNAEAVRCPIDLSELW